MREIVLDTETTGLSPAEGPSAGGDRLSGDRQSDRDRRRLSCPDQSRARCAGRRVSHSRPFDRVSGRQAGFRADRRRFSRLHRRRPARHPQCRIRHALHQRRTDQARTPADPDQPGHRHARPGAAQASRRAQQSRRAVRPLSHRPVAADQGTARCSTRKSWSRSMASCSAVVSARWRFLSARRARQPVPRGAGGATKGPIGAAALIADRGGKPGPRRPYRHARRERALAPASGEARR